MKQLVVLLHGEAGSGKDTVADAVVTHFGKDARKFALADPLKQFALAMTGTDPAIWFGESSNRNEAVELPWDTKHTFIPRKLLTAIGDALIDTTGTSLPAHITARYILAAKPQIAIVTDIRYFSELQILKEQFPDSIAVRVHGSFSKLPGHLASQRSEAGIANDVFDLWVNNLPGQLHITVDQIVKAIEYRRDQCL